MPSNCRRDATGLALPSCPNTPGWQRVWRTHLNVLTVNGTVLMPTFAQDATAETAAREIWQGLGYQVADVPSDHIIVQAGSVHCITKSLGAAPSPAVE